MMGFQEFWKNKERMCDSHTKNGVCREKCGLSYSNNNVGKACDIFILDYPKEAEEIVQKWVDEHPVITNADKFEEVFGYKPDTNVCMGTDCEYNQCITCECDNWWNQDYIPPESVK